MDTADATRLMELLASKICHDLISPVGAVSNGVEILEEIGPDAGDDVTDLIAFSAGQANAKLKALRLAYGAGGADVSIKAEDVYNVFGSFIEGDNRISQNWDPYADLGIENRPGFSKVLMSCLLFAIEGLPKGGAISVRKDTDGTTMISGEGDGASFREGYVDALHGRPALDQIENKHVHAYITGLLVRAYDFEISVDETQDGFIFLRLTSTGTH